MFSVFSGVRLYWFLGGINLSLGLVWLSPFSRNSTNPPLKIMFIKIHVNVIFVDLEFMWKCDFWRRGSPCCPMWLIFEVKTPFIPLPVWNSSRSLNFESFFPFYGVAGRNAQSFLSSALCAGATAGMMALAKSNGRQICSRPRLCGLF